MNKKSYLLVFNRSTGTQDEVKDALNKMHSVHTWRYDMPNMFYLVSKESADELVEEFEQVRGTDGLYVFIEYTENCEGRLLDKSWFLLNNKRHKRGNDDEQDE